MTKPKKSRGALKLDEVEVDGETRHMLDYIPQGSTESAPGWPVLVPKDGRLTVTIDVDADGFHIGGK